MSDHRPRRLRTFVVAAALLVLAACDTAEERAEKHYQNALALLSEGDVPRAIVELRTVFQLDGRHRDARATLAQTLLEQGRPREAFAQYLRLIEQYPNDVEARLILAELSLLDNSFDLAAEHGDAVIELAPDSVRAQIIQTAIEYRNAVLADDRPRRRAAADRALEMSAVQPDSIINQTVIIDHLTLEGDFETAMERLDAAQRVAPTDRRFYQMRLQLLAQMGDDEGIEATLREMVETFPEDASPAETLMQFYASRNNLGGAEQFLRDRIVPGVPDDTARVTLVRFLTDVHGPDVALVEAERLVEEGTNGTFFRALRASLLYDTGRRAEGLAEFREIVEDGEESDQARDIAVSYAQLLEREGNGVAARALVEEVLTEDPSHVLALIMRADWLTEADLADEAILALRRAQDQDPDEATIYSRMAQAHLRNGDRELAGEMLSLAADVSNRGVHESLNYARFLFQERRYLPAESVLVEALRFNPRAQDLLQLLGEVYIALDDWPRAEQVERAIRRLDSETGPLVADQLRLNMLRAQERDDDVIAFLQTLTERSDGALSAEIAIVTTLIEQERNQEARAYLDRLLAAHPDDENLRFMFAALSSVTGDLDTAAQEYRRLIDRGEGGERAWMELIRVLNQAGRTDEAERILSEGLTEIPEAQELLWMRASFLERQRDLEGALAIYEDLYARNSATSVIANNLASLLSTVRDDEESLERAARIARRLRESDFPPYMDTYGWIQFRRGNVEEALRYLRPAARGLATNPLVQYHLGRALESANETDAAIDQYELALALAGEDPRPAFSDARERLRELQNRDSAAPSAGADVDALPSAIPRSVSE